MVCPNSVLFAFLSAVPRDDVKFTGVHQQTNVNRVLRIIVS